MMTPHKLIHDGEPLDGDLYGPLRRVLGSAFSQSASGKGRERHANNKPFLEQPIMEIARMVGLGGHTYQVCKKAQEATSMASRNEFEAAKAEMLGIIVYASAGFLLIEELQEKENINGR
ncbi:MAG: hypothetical protein KGZ69_08800 [Methylomonas sp.]|nr:hypothetical protein [Methylomonas sp.]